MEARDRPLLLWGAVIGVALLAGLLAWLGTRDEDDPSPAQAGTGIEVQIVDEGELAEIAASSGHPVYWAGTIAGTELEASEDGDGDVQVRYLEEEDRVGEVGPDRVAISSYPLPDPTAAVEQVAGQPGSVVRRSPSGLEYVVSDQEPTSIYFASPDNSVQVEVYAPSIGQALKLMNSEQVRPVE